MIHMVVVLYLITWNCDTGDKLFEEKPMIATSYSVSGDRMEDCRRYGVQEAGKRTAEWRAKGFSNASTNVKCWWEPAEKWGL